MNREWTDSRVLVVGAGQTGSAVSRWLSARGARVWLSERDPACVPPQLLSASVELLEEREAPRRVPLVDVVIPSPGVPPENPVLQAAVQAGKPVWSEIELAARWLQIPIVAITGTNGKSTTTVLVGEILRAAGEKVFVGGNLGTPLIEATESAEYTCAVAEVSSFQLEWVETFRPRVGVFLNLSPDHLDRYPTLDAYGATKLRLFARQDASDFAVLNRDDPWVWSRRHVLRASLLAFGFDSATADAFVEGERAIVRGGHGAAWELDLSRLPLRGRHNRENILAALLTARALGASLEAARAGLERMKPLPHRLEFVCEWQGVKFYDDSKGTNVDAVYKSLRSFPGNVILLAGGYDKGSDFRVLRPCLQERVRHAVFFGAAGPKWAEQVGDVVPHTVVPGLQAAVHFAARIAAPGDVVLLSPGCASFDEFRDYAHRGRCFQQWVREL